MWRKWLKYRLESEKKFKKGFDKFIDKLFAKYRGKFTLILFGSRAVNRHHIWSDFDLLLILEKFDEDNLFRRINKLVNELKPNFPINLIPLTPDEFKESYRHGSVIIKEALRNGKIIHDGLGLLNKLNSGLC